LETAAGGIFWALTTKLHTKKLRIKIDVFILFNYNL